MDRGWHHTTCLGPERPRLGQQPYDRGRGVSSDRRGCYECGHDGHIRKFCPLLDGRYFDSGRLMERSAGGGNGRWGHDSWASSRITSSMGKEHGYARTESTREGSSSRRPHFDYHESADLSSQRPRDSGDKHRDNDGRGQGVVAASNANIRERDSKSGRSSSRKPADENNQAPGGHRGEERRDNRGKEVELISEKLAAKGDTLGHSPPNHLIAGGEDLKVQNGGKEVILIPKLSGSEAELGAYDSITSDQKSTGPALDEHVAQQFTAGSQKEVAGSLSERVGCQRNGSAVDGDLECTAAQTTRTRVSSRRSSSTKLPLSVLCKDAAEGNLERQYRHEKTVLSCVSESAAPVDPISSSSIQKVDTPESRAERQGDVKLDCPIHQDEEGIVKAKNCETIHSPANELQGPESHTEREGNIKLDCPSLCQDKEGTVRGKNCEAISSPGNEQQVETECTKDKDNGECRVAGEHSEQRYVDDISVCDESQGKGKRISRWSVGKEEAEARDSANDDHISLKQSVSDHAEGFEKVLPSGTAEQDPKSQLACLGFVEAGHQSPGKETIIVERDKLLLHSEDGTSDLVRSSRSLEERDDESKWHRRGLAADCHLRDRESDFRGGEREPEEYRESIDGVGEKDSFRQPSENIVSSYFETPVRGRNHSKDRDNSYHPHLGLGSREGNVDRISDRNGYTQYGRTGLKLEYRCRDYGGGYDRAGGRSGSVNFSDFRFGDDGRERRGWGLDWRHSRIWEAHPGHSLYRPGSYVTICNARFLELRRLSPVAMSPPSYRTEPFLLASHTEEVDNNTTESQGKGWMYHTSQDSLQGPVMHTHLKVSQESEKLQSDSAVQHEGSNDLEKLEHARSPLKSPFAPSSLESKQLSVTRSPRPSQVSALLHAPAGQEHLPEQHYNLENADRDICPPGTEACGADYIDEDYEDFHIDERVEKLMDGRTLIPGKEKEIVHEALSIASHRVRQEYESDVAVEESPRSHGGFADMGDQWKYGDFGSDVQGLEGFGCDQQVMKVDAKADEAGVEAGSECGVEVASAPEPTSRVNNAVHCHAESKQESWKWPSRGGDWKLVFVVDNSQHIRGETHGPVEKGNAGHLRKVVMNGGRPLCRSRNTNLRDPRKQNQDSGRANMVETSRLQLPKFAQKALVTKVDISAEDHHILHSQQSVTVLKGPNSTTPKSQGSTPRAHLSTPVKDRSVGSVGGAKMNKSGKSSTSQGSGTGSKPVSQVKQHQPLSKGSKVSCLAVQRESPGTVKNIVIVDKRGPLRSAASLGGDQLKPADSHVETIDKKDKQNLLNGSLELPSPLGLAQQVFDLELSKCANATPLKKLFLSRSLSFKEELDFKEGHDSVNTEFSAAVSEGLDRWPHTKGKDKLSSVRGVPVSPSLSVLTPTTLNNGPSAPLRLSKTEKSQAEEVTGDDSPQYEKQLLDQSMGPASSGLHVTPFDDGARIMEMEACDGLACVSHDTTSVDGELCRQKRKASFGEDASKPHQKSIQRRRLLDNEDGSDRKAAQSSLVTHVVNSTIPFLIEDTPTKASEVDTLKAQDQVAYMAQDQNWASLNPSILRTVFRSLRGDVKTLVNAMVTCKSWLAAGRRCKSELKRADLSSVQGHSLDAVLESLPGFGGGKLRRIILKGCTVSPESLGHLLRACPSISAVEIGCNEPLKELIYSFPKVRWVGDHIRVQSPRERLTRKREDSHLKTRSLKVIGLRESSSRDGGESEMQHVSDSASKARSPDGYTCVMSTVEETLINESVQDSAITHLTHGPSDGVKHLKLNNGGTFVKSNGLNGSTKSVNKENGNSISRLQLKRKLVPGSSHRKLEKASYRISKQVVGGQRSLADKHSSTSVKLEHHSKITSSGLFEGDKTLEKEMGMMLRVMMEADTNKCFQSANIIATDSKGVPSVTAKTDLLIIEKKLKGGAYAAGKDGFKAFKEDVNHLIRTAFRNDKDRLTYSAAEKIFKLAHQQFASLENQIAGILPADSNNQGRLSGPRPFNKAGKGRLKSHSMLQHRPGKRRKAWDDDGVQKGKFGLVKKSRPGESSSGDVDSDSDSTEHETRRFSKSKKEQWWEYEGDSSEDDEEPAFMEEDEEETETEVSDSDVPSESEGEDGIFEDDNCDTDNEQLEYLAWGARMTKAAMVPPVARKYAVIEDYRIVADKERVEQKMKVALPEDYEEKVQAAKDKHIDSYSHLDIPEMRDYKPRKKLGEEVLEQEVYGIDPYTHNLLWDTMPADITGFSDGQKQQFIEERLLLALNREAKQYTGNGRAPMEYNLERVVERILTEADLDKDWALRDFCEQLLTNIRNRPKDKFVAYRKGLGVVCNKDNGLEKDEFVVEFFGEVYPPWRWYEKQDGIRSLQKKDKDTTPEFYNIFYERPKGDAAGYDLLVVDAMHKANFASRLCHSCRPNCEAKITAVNNTYIIGVYTLKPIKRGEELTFDYNSVTESKEEYNNAVCLCGSQGCRGSYLNLTGSGTFEEVILKHHGLLDRHLLLLHSCTATATSVTDDEKQEMRQAGLGSCVLSGLPPWVLKYAASLVHFMNFEKTHLPAELLKDLQLKLKQGVIEGCTEEDAKITTEGVYNQRLQNLAITLDKVRYILTKLYKNPSAAPPPLRKLDHVDMVQWIWKREGSVVQELLQCLAPHLPKETLSELKLGISKHGPHDLGTNFRQCLLWLRDELRRLPATCKARHDAAADLIHIYAYTKNFFTIEDYASVDSPSMNIHPLDLGSSRHSISGPRVWRKTYSKEYVWGQLIGWYKQSVADPGASLAKASRGCLTLPDISSCYAKSMQHDFRQGYGQKHREKMICHMEEKPQHKWPNSKFWSQFWCFKNERGLFGSPMLDAVLEDRSLDTQMVDWLKSREDVFVGPWDEQ